MTTESHEEHAAAKPLDRASMEWFFRHYLRTPADARSPLISLTEAKLNELPDATIIAARIDPLRSEGRLLAERLEAAGVEVEHADYAGVTHEFLGMGAVLPEAREALQAAATRLRKAFDEPARAYE